MSPSKYLAILAVVLLLTFGWWLRSRPPAVVVLHPQVQEVTQSVSASGSVAGRDESDVAAEVGGRVAHLRVREGQQVQAGQVLANLETSLLLSQVKQARAALETAQAQLVQAQRGPLPSEVERTQAEVEQANAVAAAQVTNAQQRLRELRNGPTREELLQARGQSDQALATLQQNLREASRYRSLYSDGHVTRQEYERAETQVQVARENYQTNYNRWLQQKVGTRAEVLAQAQAQLRQSQASLSGASASGAARLQNLREQPRAEDVEVARSRFQEARVNLDVARNRLRQADIVAPYPGLVTRIFLKPGQLTGANAALLHIVRTPAYEVQVNVDEIHLGRLKVGQTATISSDAYPDTFAARIREISPQVVSERGTIQLKLDLISPPSWLKPGQTVSANLVFEQGVRLPIVPLASVIVAGRRSTVLVLQGGRLEEREVQLGAPSATGFPVKGGVQESDWVVANRAQLVPGQRARAR